IFGMRVPKVSAGILRGMFFIAKWTGLVFFRFKTSKDNYLIIEDIWINRLWWKWFTIILRLVPLCVNVFTHCVWFMISEPMIVILHSSRLLITIFCYLSLLHLQIFHGEELISLVNHYIYLFRRVIRKPTGFGGQWELFIILISLGCLIEEIGFLLGLLNWSLSSDKILYNLMTWAAFTYVSLASNIIIRTSLFWYLSLNVLYRNVAKKLSFELKVRKINNNQRLKRTISLVKEISYVVTSLQNICNIYLLLSVVHTLLHIVVISYNMIVNLDFFDFSLTSVIIRILIDVFTLCLVVHETVKQFRCIRQLTLDMFFIDEHKDWNVTIEIFVTHLILNEFKVRPLGLFNISNELFLVIFSGINSYLILIIQSVIQLRQK
ncbi:hypothetical protein KR084_005925, partial [Drosophila pseudotakahashii]